ncbi:uncharacterized protein LOC119071734 [Bradysia coprophila]|uniref:uncharacterized protein LOC119071734 n=1 Tax=Bradysia coprophila TaxID=38358 RepID=UPI00187D74FC|nr:uncharacterized protein LOC119071734 [Bradysia coprophila]
MAQQMETTTSNYNTDSLIDEDNATGACVDSGYSSLGSLTQISSINGSSLRPSASHYLQPIYENVPINSFTTVSELTPTSQSIRRINEFHITSPISSLKRSASSLPCTPIKVGTPKKMRLDGKSRSKAHLNLIDNIHVDENSENRDIANVEFSPIKAVNVLQERNGKFERKGSFSSTPIYEESLLKSMSVSKTDFFNSTNRRNENSLVIRKTKSFSPSKQRLLVQRNRPVETAKPIPEDKELPCTPVRRSIKRMLCRQDALETSPQPSTSSLFDLMSNDSFTESDINLESPVIFKSPSPSPPQSVSSNETPIKKIRRNLSFNLPQQSPKKELDKIIFSKIPCSPRKQRLPATKRSSTTKDVAVVAKRPQYDLSPLLPKRASYAHLKYFDILSHLAETTTAIQKIFSYVGPKDIYRMYNVCQQWRTIIKNDTFASGQRNKYLGSLMRNKENLQKKPLLKSRSLNAVPKSPLKRANTVNLRKNSLRKLPTQSSFDEETLLLIKENQRRTKCINCGYPSIITKHQNNEPNKINENRIPFQRSIYCDQNLFRSDPIRSAVNEYDVAECTNRRCAFKFCMNCKSDYHGSDPCRDATFIAPVDSDDEDDAKVNYSTGSRSKRNLRRLCSLDRGRYSSVDKVKFSSLG